MAESNKNYLDSLPDEVTMKILENLDGISNRSNVAQVCSNLNRLVKDKHWRKSIFISEEEYDRFSDNEDTRMSCADAIVEEINHSDCLESLTIELPKGLDPSLDHGIDQCSHLFCLILKKLRGLRVYAGQCHIYSSNHNSHLMILFTPKNNRAYYDRRLCYYPINTTCLSFVEEKKNVMIEEIVNNCKETLQEFVYKWELRGNFEGKITLPLLRQLSKCMKLNNIILLGHFDLPNNLSETELPNIRSEVVYLLTNRSIEIHNGISKMIAATFFCDTLHSLAISYRLLRGVEAELCSKCLNLRYLTVVFRRGDITSGEMFTDFCNSLLRSLNDHSLIYQLQIVPIIPPIESILLDCMNRILTVEHTYRMDRNSGFLIFTRQERNWSLPSTIFGVFVKQGA